MLTKNKVTDGLRLLSKRQKEIYNMHRFLSYIQKVQLTNVTVTMLIIENYMYIGKFVSYFVIL